MGAQCSICSRGLEAATVVNEALWAKNTLKQISTATNFHPSSIDRHKKGSCVFSFPNYKSSRIKNKNRAVTEQGRLIVCWPSGDHFPGCAPGTHPKPKFTLFGGEEISPDKLTASDTLLRVEYARPLLSEQLIGLAFAEDGERFPKLHVLNLPDTLLD
jgi:hypothetical protein